MGMNNDNGLCVISLYGGYFLPDGLACRVASESGLQKSYSYHLIHLLNQIEVLGHLGWLRPDAVDAQWTADNFTRMQFQIKWGEPRKLLYLLMLHGY